MAKDSKKAKFFCENCGSEVAKDARFCKKCGRFFAAVRCPKCFKVGTVHTFKNGCPSCGYAGKPGQEESNPDSVINSQNKGHFYFHKRHPSQNIDFFGRVKERSSSASLPLWIYLSTFAMLVVAVVVLVQYCAI